MKVTIEKLVYGGDGLGREADGHAVFVPFVLPGELVKIPPRESVTALSGQISSGSIRLRRGESEGALQTLWAVRGCQYQHASYGAQIAIKADILSETLERVGLRNRPGIVVHAGEPWGYRNRIRLRVEVVDGVIRFGYNLRETREFLPIEECPISAPVLWRAASSLMELCARDPMCALWLEATTEVEFFTTGDEQSLQMTLFLREERSAGFAEFCEKVRSVVGKVVGVGVVFGDGGGLRGLERLSWGKGGMMYVVESKGYWVSRGGFFQVNRWLVGELVRVVTEGRKGLIAWDLFAGVGLFSRVLADKFRGGCGGGGKCNSHKGLSVGEGGEPSGFGGFCGGLPARCGCWAGAAGPSGHGSSAGRGGQGGL